MEDDATRGDASASQQRGAGKEGGLRTLTLFSFSRHFLDPFGVHPYHCGFLCLQVPSYTTIRQPEENRTLCVSIPIKQGFSCLWFQFTLL